jgi:hypothetical protein
MVTMKKYALLAFVFVLLVTGSILAQDNTLHVNAAESLGTISPYVYGSNLGQNAIIPIALLDTAAQAGVNYARLGGGDSDRRDVQTGTIDVFVYQARAIGAEPAMTVRLLGGTPEDAAEAVRYANIERGHNIRYWSIGNEPNIFASTIGEDWTTEQYNTAWRAIAEAMLAVDPTITLVGPDITQYVPLSIAPDGAITYEEAARGGHPRDSEGRDWLQEFLRANGDLVDIVSVHRYPYPGHGGDSNGLATIDGLRENAAEWDIIIPNLRQIIRDTAGRDIPIAITEINSNSDISCGAEASLDSFYNALWFGDVLGRLIRQGVEIVASWDMQGAGTRCYGLITTNGVRPIYYTYVMYTHFGTELVQAESSDPHLSLYAALRDDGALTLLLINLGDDEKTATLSLEGFTPGGDAEVWRFDAAHNAELIEPQTISDDASVTVTGQSMTMFVIPG